jgi:predicted DCC family thiol-disulfide oxidoreductase YuxK
MKTFKDSKDRTWSLEVNVDTIEEIKTATQWNVLDLLDPKSDLAQMEAKYPPLLGQLLWPALSDQAKTKEVDEREFRRSVNGDVLSAARDILLEEIISFSPKHLRTVAAAVLQKQKTVNEAAAELALVRLDDPELQAQVMEALETNLRREMQAAIAKLRGPGSEPEEPGAITFSAAVGTLPGSSDSPDLARTPGDNSAG